MTFPEHLSLINPQTGNLGFRVFAFHDNSHFDEIQRLSYYSLIWIKKGKGMVKADFSEYEFEANTLFAFAPYQPFVFLTEEKIDGVVMNFHSDFFCIYKHHQEVACSGVLFNNIYKPPFIFVDQSTGNTFEMILEQIRAEMQNTALAQYELLVSYLKIFLITASRVKLEQQPDIHIKSDEGEEPFILQNLKNYIEIHFKSKHSASDYADLLNISVKALAKITKTHFNKTLTHLISERIIIEAKRELYLTNKAVKEIAYELGFDDEYYFSRFFKNHSDISPQVYRETVGFKKAMA